MFDSHTLPKFPKIVGYPGRPLGGHEWEPKQQEKILEVIQASAGKWCVVNHYNQYANSFSNTYFVFRIGERGIVTEESEQETALGIDIMPYKNELLGATETIVGVLENRFPYASIKTNIPFMKISGGKSGTTITPRFFDDGGVENFHLDRRDYVKDIHVGQKHIMNTYKDLIEEMDLRSKSIPFVLPKRYQDINTWINSGTLGGIGESVINSLIQQEFLESLPEGYEPPGSAQDELREEYYRIKEENGELEDLLKRNIEKDLKKYHLLKAIAKEFNRNELWFDNKDGTFKVTTDGYYLKDLSSEEDAPKDIGNIRSFKEGEFTWSYRPSATIILSQFEDNVAYLVPKHPLMAGSIIGILHSFNRYFCEMTKEELTHAVKNQSYQIPSEQENFYPSSVLQQQKPIEVTLETKG